MIEFVTRNVDGHLVCWEYDDKDELYKEWMSEDCGLPANDDPLLYAEIDENPVLLINAMFEDLIRLLGLEELDLNDKAIIGKNVFPDRPYCIAR